MKKLFKYLAFIVFGLMFLGTLFFLYQKSQPKVINYNILTAKVETIQSVSYATGKIEPRDEINIKPQISGIISELYKEEGQTVRKGEVIAKVKVIPELGQLQSAQSRLELSVMNLERAESEYNRVKQLYDKQLISKEEYEKAELNFKQSKLEKKSSESNLEIVKEGMSKSNEAFSSTLIRSTIDGLIIEIPVKVGSSVILSNNFNEGTTIATVANMQDMVFKGNISETEVAKVEKGMDVEIKIGAIENVIIKGRLEHISPKISSVNGTNMFGIRASIEVPDSIKMRSGYSATAEIILKKNDKAVVVEEEGLIMRNDSTFVMVQKEGQAEGEYEERLVKIGISDGIKSEVVSGLKEGEKVRGKVL